MAKPTIILATSNGVGMGHLARASAVALALKDVANPIIVSMAGGIAEIASFMDIRCEYIPGRDRLWMSRKKWDKYLRDRLLALIDETDAKVLSFDGVVPYPGVIATKNSNPALKLVWVRRGLWQKKPQRFILGLQSAMMDVIIEPGDIARAYDHGPTSKRKDSVLTSPVSLFKKEEAMTRDDARRALGLDLHRPVVLVQLGTGDSDVNHKMTAALEGLIGWRDLQVIVTKAPVAKDGSSLAPAGLDIKTIHYFPLAKVLHAFDAGICATGYNGVHELLPAGIPTVFVSNIRGTDNQEARARWCNDFGYALRADQSDLADITQSVRKLQDPQIRLELAAQCAKLADTTGAQEIAEILLSLSMAQKPGSPKALTFKRLMAQDHINRGLRHVANLGIRRLALVYRYFIPHKNDEVVKESAPIFSDSTAPDELRALIKASTRFEHLISGASPVYRARREEIAFVAYGEQVESAKN
ncbi:MAG: glycosyltransferase [Actinomycetota bacterium]|nr:glycosyltransferase [Actinomycetota bacterium]